MYVFPHSQWGQLCTLAFRGAGDDGIVTLRTSGGVPTPSSSQKSARCASIACAGSESSIGGQDRDNCPLMRGLAADAGHEGTTCGSSTTLDDRSGGRKISSSGRDSVSEQLGDESSTDSDISARCKGKLIFPCSRAILANASREPPSRGHSGTSTRGPAWAVGTIMETRLMEDVEALTMWGKPMRRREV